MTILFAEELLQSGTLRSDLLAATRVIDDDLSESYRSGGTKSSKYGDLKSRVMVIPGSGW